MPVETEKVRAIVFDLDRTLIISQSGFNRALKISADQFSHHLKRRGVLLSKGRLYRELRPIARNFEKEGLYNRDEWWVILLKRLGLSELSGHWVHSVTMRYWREYMAASPLYHDAEHTVRTLNERGYSLGLITDSDGTPGMKRRRIHALPFYDLFEASIVAGEDTVKIKPDDAPFSLVSKRLGVKPESCVYVGDNPEKDVRGARVTGMQTIIVRRRKRLKGDHPDLVINSLNALLGMFRGLSSQSVVSSQSRPSVSTS